MLSGLVNPGQYPEGGRHRLPYWCLIKRVLQPAVSIFVPYSSVHVFVKCPGGQVSMRVWDAAVLSKWQNEELPNCCQGILWSQ